jgi:RimJ/RimL family protein N-acetyltransferase
MWSDTASDGILPGTDVRSVSAGRVTMRRFTRADLDRRCAWPFYTEPVFEHLNMRLATPLDRDAWFRREWTSRAPFWFAVDDERGDLAGIISLREVNRWRKSMRLGIHMHPAKLNRRYGTECMNLFLDYYFTLLQYRVLKLDVAAHNVRGIRCYQKVGFRIEYEFWVPNLSATEWLKDDRFADVRPFVQVQRGVEQVKHWEMSIDAATFRGLRAEARGQQVK